MTDTLEAIKTYQQFIGGEWADSASGETLEVMIKEDLVAERIAVETYGEVIRWIGNDDPTTRRIMHSWGINPRSDR